VIVADGVGIEFLFDRHLRVVTPGEARLRGRGLTTWGLRDLSFELAAGDGTALIGPSGSGKTTLLRVLAGIYTPDVGTIEIHGRVASLLSIDGGLLQLLTGRENALLLAVLSGLSRRTAVRALDAIKERSGLEDAFERPVLTYSQGMRARLGIAVAEEREPQILVLDEVHEALDHEFRHFLQERARAILAGGGIVIAAGHDHGMLARLCSHALWLEAGMLRQYGPFAEVQQHYLASVQGGS
jgi:ABC-type polysaccharide/polyol phosphate transport system ATPase subunit